MATVKLSKWGNSNAIRLPLKVLDSLKIDEDEIEKGNVKFDLSVVDQKIIVEKVDNTPSIVKLFEGYDGNYVPTEFDWGEDVGSEKID